MISVIIPVYKSESYIDKCLESVINQTYSDLEIILIDDGSPDRSGEIIEQWALKDNRIKVIHQENSGPSKARNVGLDLAKGDEIIFIDGDDIVSVEMCDKLHNLLNIYNCQIAICGIKHIFDSNEITFDKSNVINVYTPKEAILDMWYQKTIIPSPCARIFKRSIFNDIRFKENIIFEDVEIMPRLFEVASTIVYSNEELYGYYHHEGSITTNPFSQKDLDILNICETNLKFATTKDDDYLRAAYSYYVVGALRVYLNAPKHFVESITKSKCIIDKYGKIVLRDKEIRKKLKYSLLLYFYAKPFLKLIYRRINRWK